MFKVGIVGFGFMGKMHFRCYEAHKDVTIAAICDTDKSRLEDTAGAAGNVAGAEQPLDMTGIELYTEMDKMLAEADLDAVSITVPTNLHRDLAVKTLDAGVNTLCEKPMAMDIAECQDMIAAQNKNNKVLQIGHCLRFWPEYVKAKEIIDSGKYGKVKAATFQRLSMTPTWSWDNWLMTGVRSGGALMDLHIHDSDFVQYLFGMPKSVSCHGVKGPGDDYGHVVTNYIYDDEMVITAEGGWLMTLSFGFEMSFNFILDKATIVFDCTREPAFKVCPLEGEPFTPEIETGDGYVREIAHFIKAIDGQKVPEIITPAQSLDSVKLILAERASAQSRKEVAVK